MRTLSLRAAVVVALVSLVPPSGFAQERRAFAPGELPALAAMCGSGVQWHATDPRVLEEGANRAEVDRSGKESREFDRSAALNAALAAAKGSNRLVFWYAPRIAAPDGHQMYRPALLDGYMNGVLFSDPECVAALNRKFVCVRLVCDKALGKRFDITAPAIVEPAILVLDADGAVVRSTHSLRSFNTSWFLAWLRGALEARPGSSGPSPELAEAMKRGGQGAADSLALAEQALLDLDWAAAAKAAEAALGDASAGAKAAALLARTQWRQGQTRAALETLERAEQAAAPKDEAAPRRRRGRGPAGSAELACERGRALLHAGRLAEAAEAFRQVRTGARRSEAAYHLGLCEFFSANDADAARVWKEATMAGSQDPWAWKAATNLVDGADRTPVGAAIHGFEDPFAPMPGALAGTTTSAVPVAAADVAQLSRAAFEYLLRMQRESGGWTDSRYAYWPTPDLTPNAWVAVSATACAALLEWRELDPKRVDEALRRGEAYIFDERRMNRGFNEEIYADAYKLVYLSKKYDRTPSEEGRRAVVERMNEVVRELERTQFAAPAEGEDGGSPGFWAHEYPNPFSTAAVMDGLQRAKSRGATVPAAVMTRGAEALLSVRSEDGAFSYGSNRPREGAKLSERQRDEARKNSMARAPSCEAAILWAGHAQGSQERLATAMDRFWTFLDRFEKVRRCDFHTDGELAGFFWWHSLFHTSEAVSALPEAAASEQRGRLLELVRRLGELDGSFIDSHEMGKSYGTAMGLLTLKNLLSERRP